MPDLLDVAESLVKTGFGKAKSALFGKRHPPDGKALAPEPEVKIPRLSDLLEDPDFKSLHLKEQREARMRYFDRYIRPDSDFQGLAQAEQGEVRARALGLSGFERFKEKAAPLIRPEAIKRLGGELSRAAEISAPRIPRLPAKPFLPPKTRPTIPEIRPAPTFLGIRGTEPVARGLRGTSEVFSRFLAGQLRGATIGATEYLPPNILTRKAIPQEVVKKSPELKKFKIAEDIGEFTGFLLPASIAGAGLGAAGVTTPAAEAFGTGSILGATREAIRELGTGEKQTLPEAFEKSGKRSLEEGLGFLAFQKGAEAVGKLVPRALRETKKVIEPSKKIVIGSEEIQKFREGKTEGELGEVLKEFPNLNDIFRTVIKTGRSLELVVPSRVITTIQDRPWFKSFKEAFNLRPTHPRTYIRVAGEKTVREVGKPGAPQPSPAVPPKEAGVPPARPVKTTLVLATEKAEIQIPKQPPSPVPPKTPQVALLAEKPVKFSESELGKLYSELEEIAPKAQVPDKRAFVNSMPDHVAENLGVMNKEVHVNAKALKHIIERRGGQARNIVEQIPQTISNPTHVFPNPKRENSHLFIKTNGGNLTTVLEVDKQAGKNEIVSAFFSSKLYVKQLAGRSADLAKASSIGPPSGPAEAEPLAASLSALQPTAQIVPPSPPEVKPSPPKVGPALRAKHFTTKEAKEALERGEKFDFTKKPIHGTGSLAGEERAGRFAGDRLYLSLDDKTWGRTSFRKGEDKIVIVTASNIDDLEKAGAEFFYDYRKQEWTAKAGAEKVIESLESVEYEIDQGAKIKVIDSIESYRAAEKEIGQTGLHNEKRFFDALAEKYDAVVFKNVRKIAKEEDHKFFKAILADQIIVLNPDKARIVKPGAGGVTRAETEPLRAPVSPRETLVKEIDQAISKAIEAENITRRGEKLKEPWQGWKTFKVGRAQFKIENSSKALSEFKNRIEKGVFLEGQLPGERPQRVKLTKELGFPKKETPTERPEDPIAGTTVNVGNMPMRLDRPAGHIPSTSAVDVMNSISEVLQAFGGQVPIRVGRIPPQAKAVGIFKVFPELIRIQTANDIPTSAHELAHAIEKLVFGWSKGGPWRSPFIQWRMQQELLNLGKALYGPRRPHGGYKREGFAEFVRLWLTNPDQLQKRAPAFLGWFNNQFLKENPKGAVALSKSRESVKRFQEQGSVARAKASVVDLGSLEERMDRAKKIISLEKFIQTHVEMLQPLFLFSQEVERKLGRKLTPEEDPFFTAKALRTTHDARVRVMVEEDMIDLAGNPVGPPLADITSLVKGRKADFTIYLWAKRAMALWDDPKKPGGRNPGLAREDAEQIIKELETTEFQLAAQKVYDWNEGVLNYIAAKLIFGRH